MCCDGRCGSPDQTQPPIKQSSAQAELQTGRPGLGSFLKVNASLLPQAQQLLVCLRPLPPSCTPHCRLTHTLPVRTVHGLPWDAFPEPHLCRVSCLGSRELMMWNHSDTPIPLCAVFTSL